MRCIDLSHAIAGGMPVFPGTAAPEIGTVTTLEGDGFVETRITLTSHVGTHVDAPAHMLPEGRALDHFGPDTFVGPAVVLDLSGRAPAPVDIATLAPFESRLHGCAFALLATGWSRYWGEAAYFEGYPTLTPAAARWLAAFALKGVGVDAPSVDTPSAAAFPVHRVFLGRETLIVENLTHLEQLPDAVFTFVCLPLPLAASDGAPVRAVALID